MSSAAGDSNFQSSGLRQNVDARVPPSPPLGKGQWCCFETSKPEALRPLSALETLKPETLKLRMAVR
jgi:hypothetical protein